MKKISILLVMLGLFLVQQSFASAADVFSYDAGKVNSELSALDAVDAFVSQTGATFTGLMQEGNPLVANLSYGTTGAFGIQMLEPVAGIPSFVWGFCGGVLGVALVYFISEDQEETKKAAYGCAASVVVGVGFYFFWWLLWAAT